MSFDSAELTLDAMNKSTDFVRPVAQQSFSEENTEAITPWVGTQDQEPVCSPLYSLFYTLTMAQQPSPTPRAPGRSFGFAHKPSFASFGLQRQQSITSFATRPSRPSESYSIESGHSAASTETAQTNLSPELRKAKSSMSIFTNILKKSRSRPRLRSDADRLGSFSQSYTFLPPPEALSSFLLQPSPPAVSRRDKGRKRKDAPQAPPTPPPKDEVRIDMNFDDMAGIVDLTVLPSQHDSSSSPGSGFELEECLSSVSHSDASVNATPSSPTTSMFINPNPFQAPDKTLAIHHRHVVHLDHGPLSPKSLLPVPPTRPKELLDKELPDSPSWNPPQSWAVFKDGEDTEDPEYSGSEDSVAGGGRPTSSFGATQKRKSRRKVVSKPPTSPYQTYKVRIYRADNTYHVAAIGLSVTVQELTPSLKRRLLQGGGREVHKLYLKERGRGKLSQH